MRTPSLSAALTILVLAGCGREEPPLSTEQPANLPARVTVLGADVLVVDGKHLRLSNVFAPEGPPRARCWAEALAAREAARQVQDMVSVAHTIDVSPSGGRDEYNRVYALVRLDGVDLGQVLYSEGFVAKPSKGRFEWCEPLSTAGEGPPPLMPLMGVGRR